MEAQIPVAEIVAHRRLLKVLRPRHLKLASVTLTVSDQFLVTGPGFQHALLCEPVRWGGLLVPYWLWRNFVGSVSIFSGWRVTVEGEKGRLRFGETEFRSRRIAEVGPDRQALSVPLDPTPAEVLKAACDHLFDGIQQSALGGFAAVAARRLQKQLRWASRGLAEYGIGGDDLAPAVGRALGVEDPENFAFTLSLLAEDGGEED